MFYIVARIVERGNLIGYKVINTKECDMNYNYQSGSYTIEKIENALRAGFKIENATLSNNSIKGVGGSLSRYSAISTSGELISDLALTVLQKKDEQYSLSDPYCKRIILKEDKLIQRAKMGVKLANSKLCIKENGTAYISAIEGEIPDYAMSMRENERKKFKLCMLNRSDPKYAQIYLDNKKFKSSFISKNSDINFDTLSKKYGMKQFNGDACNEVFYAKESSRTIGVTELKYGEYTHFLVQLDRHRILLEDIIYIGNGWKSKARTYSTIEDNDYHFVALGQLGLIVTKNTDYVKCIPYSKIDTVESLTNALVNCGITCGMLDKSDAKYILNTAKNAIYRLDFNIDLANAEISRGGLMETEDGTSLLSIGTLEGQSFGTPSSIYTYTLPKYMLNVIGAELHLVFKHCKQPAYFAHINSLIFGYKSELYVTTNKGEREFVYKGLKVKHFAYYCLYKLGLADKINTAWVDEGSYETLNDSIVLNEIRDGQLIVVVCRTKLVYDLDKLKKELAYDLEQLEILSKKVKKLNSKIALLGGYVAVDDAGYIYDWEDGAEIIQTDNIKGIKVTRKTSRQAITVFVTGKFETYNKELEYISSYNMLLAFNKNTEQFIQSFKVGGKYRVGLNLDSVTSSDLNELVATHIRNRVNQKTMIVNGESKIISVESVELTTDTLIKHAGKLLTNSKETYYNLEVLNKDKIDPLEKSKFLSLCINSITKRCRIKGNASVKLVEEIIGLICEKEEREKLLDGFSRWLSKQ